MHTKGQWEIQNIPSHGLEICAKVDIGKEDMSGGVLQPIYAVSLKPSLSVDDNGAVTMMVCYESWRQFPSINFKEMQEDNAHLIAAAPELLEALELCHTRIFNYQAGMDKLRDPKTTARLNDDALAPAEKVIRKAKGE